MLNIWVLSGCAAAIVGNSGVVVYDSIQDSNEICSVVDLGDVNGDDHKVEMKIVDLSHEEKTVDGEIGIKMWDAFSSNLINAEQEADQILHSEISFNNDGGFDVVDYHSTFVQNTFNLNKSRTILDQINEMSDYEYHLSNAATARVNAEIAKNQISENDKMFLETDVEISQWTFAVERLEQLLLVHGKSDELIEELMEKKTLLSDSFERIEWLQNNTSIWTEEFAKWTDLAIEEENFANEIIRQNSQSL